MDLKYGMDSGLWRDDGIKGLRESEGVMWVKGLTLRGGKTRKPTLLVELMILCTEIGGQSGLMIGGEQLLTCLCLRELPQYV